MSEIISLSNQDNHSVIFSSSKVGQIGEELAVRFLEKTAVDLRKQRQIIRTAKVYRQLSL